MAHMKVNGLLIKVHALLFSFSFDFAEFATTIAVLEERTMITARYVGEGRGGEYNG